MESRVSPLLRPYLSLLLLVPKRAIHANGEPLSQIIEDINATKVLPEDFLSNTLYYYDATARQIQAAKTREPISLVQIPARISEKEQVKAEQGIQNKIKDYQKKLPEKKEQAEKGKDICSL